MKRRILLSLVAVGLSLALGLPVPAHAGQGGNFEVPIQGRAVDPDSGLAALVGGAAKVHINFDGPGGGCIHVLVHWQDVFGVDSSGVQYDGRGVTQYEQFVNPNQFAVTFRASFNLMADRPGGGCIHVNALITAIGDSGGIKEILIGLLPRPND